VVAFDEATAAIAVGSFEIEIAGLTLQATQPLQRLRLHLADKFAISLPMEMDAG
jgi:hypothetical protein